MNGMSPYALANLAAPLTYGPNAGAETVVMATLLEAGSLPPQSRLRVSAGGLITTVGGAPELDVRWRLGPVTLTGTILGSHRDVAAPAADLTWRLFNSNNQSGKGWRLDAEAVVQSNGTGITTTGLMVALSNNQFQFGNLPVEEAAMMSFDPTIDNLLELTLDFDDVAANTVLVKTALFALEYSA